MATASTTSSPLDSPQETMSRRSFYASPELVEVVIDPGHPPAGSVPTFTSAPSFKSSNQPLQLASPLQLNNGDHSLAPGIDPVRIHSDIPQLSNAVSIQCVDFNRSRISVRERIDNENLTSFLAESRPDWSRVRWLNVKGLDFEVIRILAEKFHLHPLAVEDVVHFPQRIKADYYENHLYISMILVALEIGRPAIGGGIEPTQSGPFSHLRTPLGTLRKGLRRLAERGVSLTRKHQSVEETVQENEIYVEQASFFLLPHNTLLTFFQKEGGPVTEPIISYLDKAGTQLRDSDDASLLLHLLIDHTVDHAKPVVSHYTDRLAEMEEQILTGGPRARYTSELHLMASDLNKLKKALVPTQHLVHTLRNKRAITAAAPLHTVQSSGTLTAPDPPPLPQVQCEWLSKLTRTYLDDVNDHAITIVEDIHTLQEQAKDLSGLVFNTISFHSTRAMQMLSVTSFIFLPLTFIAGVYGTNFVNIPELNWHLGYMYFWLLCAGMAVFCVAVIRMVGWAA